MSEEEARYTRGQRPIQDGLFTWPSDRPQLIASRCTNCGELTFPTQASCPACTSRNSEEVLLSRRGTLWTWTVQHFPSPSPPYVGDTDPETFEPFAKASAQLARHGYSPPFRGLLRAIMA